MTRLAARLRTRAGAQDGFTVVELVTVMAILLIVLTALTTLFVSGTKAELDMNRRFQAQQEARLAVDKMRREIHCANGITLTSASSITVALPAACPSAGGTQQNIVYDTQLVSTGRYTLRRAGVQIADYVTTGDVFSYALPSTTELGKLHVNVPVDLTPADTLGGWRLETDIVLRNTTRA